VDVGASRRFALNPAHLNSRDDRGQPLFGTGDEGFTELDMTPSTNKGDSEHDPADDEPALVVNGRRWRRTDPSLPEDVVAALKSHLGRGRSGVRTAKKDADDDAVAAARRRVGLAKHGLGERGPYWWDDTPADRLDRAHKAIAELDALDAPSPC
jgi:hypothetical protein